MHLTQLSNAMWSNQSLSLTKTRQQVLRSPCHAQAIPPPHGDQSESQKSSKPSDMPLSTSIFPHEKLQVLTDKVYTISMQYEV